MIGEHDDLSEADKLNEGPGPLFNERTVPLLVTQIGVRLLGPGGDRDDKALRPR